MGVIVRIVEKRFRGSLICRVLGYPISYGIVKFLLEKGKLDLDTIAKYVKRSKQATCSQLTKLRLANLVRYETEGTRTCYWIKYPKEIAKLLDTCESLVGRISRRLDKDF
jgi:predicted transcriptional regulator